MTMSRHTFETFFAGENDNSFFNCPSKLYFKSNWNPPPGDIPPDINEFIDLFCKKLNT